ncbi:Uncharacterised protein [Mycobacteroides abscessus subsp. abscessus]|nr:Uncharacterised protein [Mycobacteroides abscessus subsp. abscessus]
MSGWAVPRWSQMVLCSRMNSECRIARPTQKLAAVSDWLAIFSTSSGGRPSRSRRSRPPCPVRKASAKTRLLP